MSEISTRQVRKTPRGSTSAALPALLLAPLIGCSPGDSLSSAAGLVLACAAILLFAFVCSGIWHAVTLVWPRLSPDLRRLIWRSASIAVFYMAGRHWDRIVAPLDLDETLSALGLLVAFVLGLRQIVLLVTGAVALLQRGPEAHIRVRADPPRNSTPRTGVARASQAQPEVHTGPTCWICGGVNDGHRH